MRNSENGCRWLLKGVMPAVVLVLGVLGMAALFSQSAWAEGSEGSGDGGYSSRGGSLTVTISPSAARDAGAQWRVDGGSYRNSGSTVGGLSEGSHTVSYKAISGWTTPSNQRVDVRNSRTTSTSATYVRTTQTTGSLQVNLLPAGAVSAGAQWSVDGGDMQNSGATVTGLSAGSHSVTFKTVSGYTTPAGQTVTVTANAVTTATGTYTAVATTGSLQVNLLPAGAITAGAKWQVDGGALQNSGATVTSLSTGSHTVTFGNATGYTAPASQTVNILANALTTATGNYTAVAPQTGSLSVTLLPAAAVTAGARWQVDGGAMQSSGATVAGLSVGSHTVAFSTVSGYTTPGSQTVSILANATATATGTYVAVSQTGTGSLQVTLQPSAAVSAGAKWSVDGGAVQSGGNVVSGLSAGTHVLSFAVVAKWIKPVSQTITITANQTATASGTYTQQLSSTSMVVLGYNELGMHCMNEDFSDFMILPPYNNFHAQVIRRGGEPSIVQSGVTVSYTVPGNTTSADKTNFWTYAPALFGQSFAPNVGLTGNKLSGTLVSGAPDGRTDWGVTGIPITPLDDTRTLNPYQLATVTVAQNGTNVCQTQAPVPVSWEISCEICHNTPGMTPGMDILTAHDAMHGTDLVNNRPVACGSCHAQPELGFPGVSGIPTLSSAMHSAHAPRMAMANLDVACYACHPGFKTQCLRDVHYLNGMTCVNCHGDMTAVADPSRTPWVNEPSCGGCHTSMAPSGFEFEQPNTLFRNSKGHHNVMCASCHGSPHAITPTNTIEDNIQAIADQGHAGTIDTCTVCHTSTPNEAFPHRAGG